jgi:hypothetical protein
MDVFTKRGSFAVALHFGPANGKDISNGPTQMGTTARSKNAHAPKPGGPTHSDKAIQRDANAAQICASIVFGQMLRSHAA